MARYGYGRSEGRGMGWRGPRYGGDYGTPPYGWSRYDQPYREGWDRYEDESVRRAVRWTLFEDTWLDARGIDIEVRNGVVTLTGEVKDYLSARYAWDDAWETPGVRGVISRLEVREAPST